MSRKTRLLFVYNADSGLFNTLADAAHKIVSPDTYQCDLCKITYGWFTERTQWRRFLGELGAECEFLHRDQFLARHPGNETPLPAVFEIVEDEPRECISAARLGTLDLNGLMEAVEGRCVASDPDRPEPDPRDPMPET
jgi:hypothetical protein